MRCVLAKLIIVHNSDSDKYESLYIILIDNNTTCIIFNDKDEAMKLKKDFYFHFLEEEFTLFEYNDNMKDLIDKNIGKEPYFDYTKAQDGTYKIIPWM